MNIKAPEAEPEAGYKEDEYFYSWNGETPSGGEPDPTSPQTGDSSNMAPWIALLFISGGAIVVLTVAEKKKLFVRS